MSDKMSIDKKEQSKDNSEAESLESSPEHDQGPASAPQDNQPAKRKGGRKPIYATSEERKQRNRQAQAAFRERRTEYIKQLEEAIRVHESNLSNLQAAHRGAADECLMLRYKNSLLERILLEKGIDVQAELRAKTGSPNLGPNHMPQNMVPAPPIQRAILSRHHQSRKSTSSIAPKLENGHASTAPSMPGAQTVTSPKSRQPPVSHAASPTNPNPNAGFRSHSISSPTTAEPTGMRPAMPQQMKPPLPAMQGPMAAAAARQGMMQPGSGVGGRANPYYPAASFNHMEQLEQEYDAPNDMMDDGEPDTPGAGPYTTTFPGGQQNGPHPGLRVPSASTGAASQAAMAHGDQPGQTQGHGYPSMTQLLDPALDWDPFGLSASMAFPAQFSFDTSNMR